MNLLLYRICYFQKTLLLLCGIILCALADEGSFLETIDVDTGLRRLQKNRPNHNQILRNLFLKLFFIE